MMRRFALLLVFSLTGCMVGPDYHLPSFDTPADWHGSKGQTSDRAMRDKTVAWWRDFKDTELNALIEKALANNENLKIAAARVVEARGSRETTDAALFPHIGAGASGERGNPGVPTLGGNATIYQAAFDASWEIDLFGGDRRQVEAQDALVGARQASYRDACLSLVAEVAREYISLRQFQAQLAITRQTAKIQHHLYEITQDHFKGGLVSTLDVAQAETLYKTTSARIPDYQRQIEASSYRLSVLLGEPPGGLDSLAVTRASIPMVNNLPVLDAPADIVRQRPDIAEAERNLAAATALQGVAISALYPKISLSSLFGIQRGEVPHLGYEATRTLWDIGSTVSMPIIEFGSIEGQIKAADARQVQSLHQYRQTVLAALGDIEIDLSNLTQETKRYRALQKAGKSADHAVDVAHDRYRGGLSDFTSVLQAEQQRFAVQIELIASQSSVAQDVIALHKALGENPAPAAETGPSDSEKIAATKQ